MNATHHKARVEYVVIAIGLIAALLLASGVSYFALSYQKLYSGFGAELPALTSLVLGNYWLVWLFPVTVVAAGLFWPDHRQRGPISLFIGIIGSVILAVFFIYAFYLPVIKLGTSS